MSPRQEGAACSQQVCDRTDFTPPNLEPSWDISIEFPSSADRREVICSSSFSCVLLTCGALTTAWAVPFSQGFLFLNEQKDLTLRGSFPYLFQRQGRLHLMVIGLCSHVNPRLFVACSELPSRSPCCLTLPQLPVLQTLGGEPVITLEITLGFPSTGRRENSFK